MILTRNTRLGCNPPSAPSPPSKPVKLYGTYNVYPNITTYPFNSLDRSQNIKKKPVKNSKTQQRSGYCP